MLALAAPAQAQGLPAGTNLSWEALDPGDDWSARVIRSVFPVTAATGGEDNIGAAGTVTFLLSTHATDLSLAAVLTSLYPVVTVLLASIALGERLGAGQRLGIGICTLAVATLAAG